MEIIQLLCPSDKYSIKCPYSMIPQGITIHNTANDASAKNEVSYMLTNNNKVSYHFAVDDIRAVQGIPLDRNAWHAGDGGNGFGNRYTIGIEICYSKSGGDRFHVAERNGAELTARLMLQYGWGISTIGTKVVNTHQSRSGKYCPHRTLDEGLERFWNMVREKYAELSGQPIPTPAPTPSAPAVSGDSYLVRVTTGALNIRAGAGTQYDITGCIRDRGTYTIVETNGDWGRLKSGAGWICLRYTSKGSGSTVPSTPTQPVGHYVGESVTINGVYTSSMSTKKLNPAVKTGTITKIVNGANNPYLLNNGNIGWVNDSCIVGGNGGGSSQPATPAGFSKGQRVTLLSSATRYCTGQTIPGSVKGKTYTIMQVGSGNTHPDGVLLKEIMSWVYKKDVR